MSVEIFLQIWPVSPITLGFHWSQRAWKWFTRRCRREAVGDTGAFESGHAFLPFAKDVGFRPLHAFTPDAERRHHGWVNEGFPDAVRQRSVAYMFQGDLLRIDVDSKTPSISFLANGQGKVFILISGKAPVPLYNEKRPFRRS